MAKQAAPVFIAAGGLDPSGGAGLAVDITAGIKNGARCLPVALALTVQDYETAYASYPVAPEIVAEQLNALWEFYEPEIIKTGLIGSAENAEVLADFVRTHDLKLILDPVTVSSSGFALAGQDVEAAISERLIPESYLVSPNILEAERLAELCITTLEQAKAAAKVISRRGPRYVWITGGHLDTPGRIIDTLYNGEEFEILVSSRVQGTVRGTGCAAASAVAAALARGADTAAAVASARDYVAGIIRGE